MNKIKLYLYTSNEIDHPDHKGTDLSDFVACGGQNTEDLTEEMDTSEITLLATTIETAFDPETKFIMEIYSGDELVETFHRVVQEDVCVKSSMADNYYDHSITLIEPSVIAQKRIVDNIAITYKLRNVNLETRSPYTTTLPISTGNYKNNPPSEPPRGFDSYTIETNYSRTRYDSFGKYFVWKHHDDTEGLKVVYTDTNSDTQVVNLCRIDMGDIKPDGNNKKWARFAIPVPHIMWGLRDTEHSTPIFKGYADIGVASFSYRVYAYDNNGDLVSPQGVVSGTKLSNSDLTTNATADPTFPYAYKVNGAVPDNVKKQFLLEREEPYIGHYHGDYHGSSFDFSLPCARWYFRRYTDLTNGSNFSVAQATPSGFVETDDFEVLEGYTYRVELRLHMFNDVPSLNFTYTLPNNPDLNPPFAEDTIYRYEYELPTSFCYARKKYEIAFSPEEVSGGELVQLSQYNVRLVGETFFYTTLGLKTTLTSGAEYTAYDLLVRAITASDNYFKVSGVPIDDLNNPNSPYPFYLSTESSAKKAGLDDLQKTAVKECYFSGKNFWEILLEVGKYIHSIPEIRFGANDKFEISFNRLGVSEIAGDKCTHESIMNSRKVDDYISACTSYVDNLVQLGGEITEFVPAKSESENYIVSNDTACIIVSKPIIELLKVEVVAMKNITLPNGTVDGQTVAGLSISAGSTKDITNYIYEKYVYNLLSQVKSDVPNKGIAMYYELGTNVIKGGDYQLPQPVTTPYSDYAFKKIIYTAYNTTPSEQYYYSNIKATDTSIWKNIVIGNFYFKVTYRTKDTARLEHTRPDLRKYLVASKHDSAPVQRQINNQQDVLLDSNAFGQNVYGKLIRTGNLQYRVSEWTDSYQNVKKKGDLVDLGTNEMYYVAKVTTTVFPDHFESQVEYSKDYNQLSEIIGIPSEPRFYEIAERNMENREIVLRDYLLITTNNYKLSSGSVENMSFYGYAVDRVFNPSMPKPAWAVTRFKGDIDADNPAVFGERDHDVKIVSPVNTYDGGGTLTYEWDMVDNFSAGDKLSDITEPAVGNTLTDDTAYRTMRAVQYCDIYGKSGLCDIQITKNDLPFDNNQILLMPAFRKSDDSGDRKMPSEMSSPVYPIFETNKSFILMKDCREVLHFNVNIMAVTDSDTFFVSPFFFSEKKGSARYVILPYEVNKISTGYINITDGLQLDENDASVTNGTLSMSLNVANDPPRTWDSYSFNIPNGSVFADLPTTTKQQAMSLVIYDNDPTLGDIKRVILAKNFSKNTIHEEQNEWDFGPASSMFLFQNTQ